MIVTKHAIKRLQQQGISLSVTEVIYLFGEQVQRPGRVFAYQLSTKNANLLIHQLKRAIHQLEKTRNKVIVVDDERESLITAYHRT